MNPTVVERVNEESSGEKPYNPPEINQDLRRYGHPYPDIFHPQAPYPVFHLNPLFRKGSLRNAKGEIIEWTELLGKSVALYFADYAKYRCRSFLPLLRNVYKTFNESGCSQKVEIVFVSLDKTEKEYDNHRAHQPWLAIPFGDELIETFKMHYRVMNPDEVVKYGCGSRTNTPALLIIRGDGQLLQVLEVSEEPRLWRRWDATSQRF